MSKQEFLSTSEAAAQLGITRQRVLDLITSERLPAQRVGNAYIIRVQDLKLVENRKTGRPRKIETTAKK